MVDFCHDQAAGLRQLFGVSRLKTLSFASGNPGEGVTSAAANAAVALARLGQEVLLVDENPVGRGLDAFFGISQEGDLLQVINHKCPLEKIMLSPYPGVRILPVGMLNRQLGDLTPNKRQALLETMKLLEQSVNIILIDTHPGYGNGFSPWGLAAEETVILVSASGDSIKKAYACIKKISQTFSRRHFRILVNRAKRKEDGQIIYENLKKVAVKNGLARLDYSGAIPLDNDLKQSTRLCQPVVTVLPDAGAAVAIKTFASQLLSWPKAGQESDRIEQFIQHLLNFCHYQPQKVLQA